MQIHSSSNYSTCICFCCLPFFLCVFGLPVAWQPWRGSRTSTAPAEDTGTHFPTLFWALIILGAKTTNQVNEGQPFWQTRHKLAPHSPHFDLYLLRHLLLCFLLPAQSVTQLSASFPVLLAPSTTLLSASYTACHCVACSIPDLQHTTQTAHPSCGMHALSHLAPIITIGSTHIHTYPHTVNLHYNTSSLERLLEELVLHSLPPHHLVSITHHNRPNFCLTDQ